MENSLNHKFAEYFIDGVNETIITMTGFELEKNTDLKSEVKYGEITGAMFATGAIRALLIISTNRSSASVFTAYMTGIETNELNLTFLSDSMVEIVNMSAGLAKAKLRDSGYSIDNTLPFAVIGTDTAFEVKNNIEKYEYILESNDAGLKISIFFI